MGMSETQVGRAGWVCPRTAAGFPSGTSREPLSYPQATRESPVNRKCSPAGVPQNESDWKPRLSTCPYT